MFFFWVLRILFDDNYTFVLDFTREQSAIGITKYAQGALTHGKYKAVLHQEMLLK